MQQRAGRITIAGITKDVTFESVHDPVSECLDEAYPTKCRSSPYLAPMIGACARAATGKVVAQWAAQAVVREPPGGLLYSLVAPLTHTEEHEDVREQVPLRIV